MSSLEQTRIQPTCCTLSTFKLFRKLRFRPQHSHLSHAQTPSIAKLVERGAFPSKNVRNLSISLQIKELIVLLLWELFASSPPF